MRGLVMGARLVGVDAEHGDPDLRRISGRRDVEPAISASAR